MTPAATRNLVLAVNPSHATGLEHAFWLRVAERTTAAGWTLVEIATRLLPHSPPAVSLTLPARLSELNLSLRDLPLGSRAGLAESKARWWGPEDYAIQEDWEYRRWGLDQRLPATLLGSMRLVRFVERALETIRPAIVLTTNKIDHNVVHFRRLARHRGIPTAIVERSPLDGIWLEPDGLFAESRVWRLAPPAAPDPALEAIGRRELDRLRTNPQGFRAAASERARTPLDALPRPLVFLPMDNVLWTGWEQPHHPMRAVDNPLYASPGEAMDHLADLVASRGGSLVVKPHPACLAIRADTVPPGAHLIHDGLEAALRAADVVACFNTKVAFPALALGKPVVTLAPNPVAASGATYHCRRADDADGAVAAALERRDLEQRLRRFTPFVGWLQRDYFYAVSEPSPPLTRGPARFVDDVLAAADEPAERIGPERLDEVLAAVTEGTGARRIGPRGRTATSAPPSPAGLGVLPKILDVLRREGLASLGRRSARRGLAWGAARLPRRALARLDTSGLDLVRVKSTHPHRVPYREDWRPLARPDSEVRDFAALWCAGLGPESRVGASGCSPGELARWAPLRGELAGGTLWVIEGRKPSAELGSLIAVGETTCLVDCGGDQPLDWMPTFYCATSWSIACRGLELPEVERAAFLPQRFRGLVRDPRIFWFGPRPRSPLPGDAGLRRRFAADVREGLCFADDALLPALQIACHLGVRRVRLIGEIAPGAGDTLEEVRAALADRGVVLEVLRPVAGSPA